MEAAAENVTTEATTEVEVKGWEMELWPRIFWDVLFYSMISVAVAGNLIVLWIVTGECT
jgi:hypothetical protein